MPVTQGLCRPEAVPVCLSVRMRKGRKFQSDFRLFHSWEGTVKS